MKPALPRKWRIFGLIFGAVSVLSLAALVAFQVFYALPLAQQARQISETRGLKASQDALALNPNDPAALRGMANEMSVYRKDFSAASNYLQRAVEVEPDNLNNQYLLAMALVRAGRSAQAKPLLENVAVGKDINRPFAKKILAKLKKNPRWGIYKPRPTVAPTADASTPSAKQ